MAWPSQHGKMADRIRQFDWSATPLGPIDRWPQSLRTVVDMMLASAVPAYVAWGPELTSFYNDAFIPILRKLAPRALGCPFRILFADIWDDNRRLIEATLAGQAQFFVDQPLVVRGCPTQPPRWFTYCWTPLRDETGLITGIYCAANETTDKMLSERELAKRREAALERSEERYRQLFNSIDEGFCVIQLKLDEPEKPIDYKFIEVNPAFENQTGLRNVAGKWMRSLAPQFERHWFEIYGEVARTGRPMRFNAPADSLHRWFDVYAFRVGTPEDRQVAALFNDITARRSAEISLRHLNETLERRVSEEVSARLSVEETLHQSQKLEAIGQLTGGLAHDFNNLLTIIRSSADLLRRASLTPEKRTRFIDAIADTADRAAKLTSQLLAFARGQSLKPEVFDVCERVKAVQGLMQTVIGPRIDLVIDAGNNPFFIEADVTQFETALVNIGANARDAMQGTGRLRVSITGETRQLEENGPAVPLVRIALCDTGEGIPSERIEHIFEPFFTTKEVGKGTGLGLSQVYGFAKQSGGDVLVQSTVGEGTTIALYLPRVPGIAPPPTVDREEETQAELHGRILVVEDDEHVGIFAVSLLQELGFTAALATDGSRALEMVRAEPDGFTAVFSDVVMPGMGGVELAHAIQLFAPEIPIVLTSGYSDTHVSEGKLDFEVLRKPYSIQELTRVLRSVTMSERD